MFSVLFIAMRIGYGILHPFYEKWFIGLFEQSVPYGLSFVMFALPTIGLIVGLILLCDISEILSSIVAGRLLPRVKNHLSAILYKYINQQSMSYFLSRYPGKMATQVNYVAGGFILPDFLIVFTSLAILIMGTSMTLALDWRIAIIMGGALAFRLAYGLWRMFPMNKSAKDASEASSTLSGKLIDSVSNFNIVKLFAGAKKEEKHVTPHRKTHVKTQVRQRFMQRLFWAVPSVGYTFLFGGIMLICASMYQNGDMRISEIVFTLAMFWAITNQINRLVDLIPNFTDVFGSAQQSYHELVKPIEITDAPNAMPLQVTNGMIEIRNLSFKYNNASAKNDGKDADRIGCAGPARRSGGGRAPVALPSTSSQKYRVKTVLSDFSITISPGEKVGLVGSSGAGKTTLVNLLMRLYDPTHGEIL
ncbi:MAG: ABC transporter ATP-binding protein/permease, partial [Rickettsiales bacterium]|nr:ABC transporter ATP-binding protein/permease [Rickettsiales bacterium]